MIQPFSKMQEYLIKVLSTMNIREENKVLISLELTEDKQIHTFLKWLKENMPEHKILRTRNSSPLCNGNKKRYSCYDKPSNRKGNFI